MAVTAMYDYNWPSRSRAELYGDAQLVHVWWNGNPYFVSAATFPFPKDMPFGAMVNAVLKDFFSADPDFKPEMLDTASWKIDHVAVTPDMEASLVANGVGHKSLVEFSI
jgi:phenol hydroxylase P4 protein